VFAVALNAPSESFRRMATTVSPEQAEQTLLGSIFRALREERGLTQADVGERLGMKAQGWHPYEAGRRKFTDEKMESILAAVGVTNADVEEMRAQILGRPQQRERVRDESFVINVYGRARAGAQGIQVYDVGEPIRTLDLRQLLGRSTDGLEVAGDSMVPWAEPGEVVLFDRDRYPKRGSGCIIETKTGEYYVKIYEKSDGSTLFVKELYPQERTITFALRDVKGVYGVRLRGD
jgi:phage repressor protein C with HTH and peptisase S24 domain